MTLLAIYSSPTTPGAGSWSEDVTSAIRLGSITGLSGEARLGATGVGNVVLDDPTSSIGHTADGIVGLKQFHFLELDAPIGNQRLWTGYVGPRTYRRGVNDSLRTGTARKIDVTLVDLNDFLGFRVFAPTADDPTSDFVRDAETDLERVQALLTEVDFISTTLFDVGYIPATGGVDMDAHDYTGMRPIDVLNDCAQASGRNFFVLYDEATNQYVLWYDVWTTDGSATRTYDSPLRLTNVLSEVDGSVTFAAIEPELTYDPSRVISAVYLERGDGKVTYDTLPTTAYIHAWRDAVMPSVFVKSDAKASALTSRYLLDNSTEDPTIRCSVQLPNQYVTSIHEGMRLEVHFTHLPIVNAGFTWTRVLSRNIRVDVETQQYYWLDLELSPLPVAEEVYSILYSTESGTITTTAPIPIYFDSSGDRPDSGFLPDPTIGPISQIPGPDYPGVGTFEWYAFTMLGVGTIDISLSTSVAGVPIIGDSVIMEITQNGTVVGSDSTGLCVTNFTWAPSSPDLSISITGLAVAYGDIIAAQVRCPTARNFSVPQFGTALDNFIITGNLTPP